MQMLFGTQISANVNLVAQLSMIAALWVGFYFAHTRQIPKHRNVQTTVVLANIFFIAFVMITSFYSYIILGGTTGGTIAVLMIIHGTLGLIAELTGIYLVLRMRTQLIPPRFRVRNFKLVMRSLLGLWTVIVALGLSIYFFRYLAPTSPATAAVSPIAHLQSQADGIALHAEELQAAAQRGNLATTKRHAEHLINLIEGKIGADYGDADRDGIVEDPGDGVGAINYLQQVREDAAKTAGSRAQAVAIADHVHDLMIQVLADAKTVIQVADLNSAAPQIAEIGKVAEQINKGPTNSVMQIAQLLGADTALPPVVVEQVHSDPNTVIVNVQDFRFDPNILTIRQGTTLIFVNQGHAKHTVTADNGKFRSGEIAPGKSFSFTFDGAGTFQYYCEFHGDKGGVDMSGKIVVQ
jgi:plastocyanin/uncharacterized membrane protein YozB (DUF420 family)